MMLEALLVQKNNSYNRINLFVFLGHFFLLCLILMSSPFKKTVEVSKKLIVHTVKLQSPHLQEMQPSPQIVKPVELELEVEPEVIEPVQEIPQEEVIVEKVQAEKEPEPVLKQEEKPIEKTVEKPQPKEEVKPVQKSVTKAAPKKKTAAAAPKSKPKKTEAKRKPEVKKKSEPKKEKVAPKATQKPVAAKKTTTDDHAAKKREAEKKAQAAREAKERDAKAKEAKAKAAKEKQLSLIADALSSLESTSSKSSEKAALAGALSKVAGAKTPSKIGSLQSEAIVRVGSEEGALSPREKTYYDELIYRIKLALKLPEYGEVKLKLTLSSVGKVQKVSVTSSKSGKNRSYVEKMLPQISFPSFGDNFSNAKEHTFFLNLSNDLSY